VQGGAAGLGQGLGGEWEGAKLGYAIYIRGMNRPPPSDGADGCDRGGGGWVLWPAGGARWGRGRYEALCRALTCKRTANVIFCRAPSQRRTAKISLSCAF
jgi:hypothetical protein